MKGAFKFLRAEQPPPASFAMADHEEAALPPLHAAAPAFLSTPLALLPTSFCRVASKSLDHPPSTSKMILHWLISYPGYLCFNSHLSGAYFSEVCLSRLLTLGQPISRAITCLSLLLTILASTLFALSSCYSPYTGASQYACTFVVS